MPLNNDDSSMLLKAISDFHEARRKESLESLMGILLGRQIDLLPYEEVRSKLRAIESARRILGDIPLDKIVGSVNRYTDFSRSFLPRNPSDQARWARVRQGVETLEGLPPIEVYRIGEVYFVLDGHHRVSVARELGLESIQGYIIPVHTRVPLSPTDSPDDLIIKSEYTGFLAATRIDELCPQANLLVTAAGQYQKLREHIAVHQYFLGQKHNRPVPDAEAVVRWYEDIYLPLVQMIHARSLLRDFPDRTETDLYLWIMEHRTQLGGGALGWEIASEKAASDLATRFSPRRRMTRLASRLIRLAIPAPFDPGPPPGAWRSLHSTPRRADRLFDDLLVALQDGEQSRRVMEMAVEVARRENARLTGLHATAEENNADVSALEQTFLQRCTDAGVSGRIRTAPGRASHLLLQHAPWVDLVLFTLTYPPPEPFLPRLQSGTRTLIRRCQSPLFAVPDAPFQLNSAMLAYGPGRKAEEALFVAAYLAARWQIPLTVLTVKKSAVHPSSGSTPMDRARAYLDDNCIQATFVEATGPAARCVAANAEEHQAGFLIMGGYESGPLRESIFGSTVDRVLRATRRPVLICR
jgi:nucleotide-binding universal stress UspA family protein